MRRQIRVRTYVHAVQWSAETCVWQAVSALLLLSCVGALFRDHMCKLSHRLPLACVAGRYVARYDGRGCSLA